MRIPEGIKRAATLIVLRHQNEFLLLKRLKAPNQGMYTPVGGKIDPFEGPKAAAIRETREETGIIVEDIQFCGILTETSPIKYNWISYVYVADIERVPPPPCNEGTLAWITFDQLRDIPTPVTDLHIYECIARGEKFVFTAEFDRDLQMVSMVEELSGKEI